ncbi:MAG TPA: hypothetical protein VHB79_02445 [Polyangiaceae bacterium]|nr:hypothetical protein [Polyangiaceae bacterium]
MGNVPAPQSAIAQRIKPAGAALVGAAVLGLNVFMLIKMQRFYPFGTMLGGALICAGGFGVAVGEPKDVYGYQPTWFKIGLGACAAVGVVIGIVVNALLVSD